MTLEQFKEGSIGPSVVLLAICVVIAFALAGIYQVTKPVIDRVEKETADAARTVVLTESAGQGFTQIDISMPEGVQDVYRANNGAGFVIQSFGQGFGGNVYFMVGMDPQGNVTGIQLFSHDETPGLGTKVGKADYLVQFYGETDPNGVEAIAGATRTSNALKSALNSAREAYELVKEVA